MSYESLLFGHLAGAFLFVSGVVAAAVVRLAAMRRTRPSEITVLLRAARLAIPLIAAGLVLAVGFGFWLASRLDLDLGSAWLSATFVLVAAIVVVGSVGGRQDRHTRELAERLARDHDRSSPELERRLRDPLNLALNASLLAATIAIVALMVWQP
ncbi:MAG TPA: DUF2269 family protein [Gaiellaceae bacterium]|nr:DUF2269 family protein [Gaiellaceae bacterium]